MVYGIFILVFSIPQCIQLQGNGHNYSGYGIPSYLDSCATAVDFCRIFAQGKVKTKSVLSLSVSTLLISQKKNIHIFQICNWLWTIHVYARQCYVCRWPIRWLFARYDQGLYSYLPLSELLYGTMCISLDFRNYIFKVPQKRKDPDKWYLSI